MDRPRSATVCVEGDFGESAATAVAERLLSPDGAADRVIIDLQAARTLDVGGIDVLIDAASVLRRCGVCVEVVPGWAEDVLRLTGAWVDG